MFQINNGQFYFICTSLYAKFKFTIVSTLLCLNLANIYTFNQ